MPSAPMCTTQERAKVLDPMVADRVHEQDVSSFIRHGEGAGGDAVGGEDGHLNLGESAPHAIAIDHGDLQASRDVNRHDRVETAGFDAHGAARFAARVAPERLESADHVIAGRQLLHDNNRRAHASRRHDKIVVIQLIESVELDRTILADGFARHQLADVGIAAAAGAQHCRAQRDVFDILFMQQAHQPAP